ncbi:AI-2E family transporter [Oscillibacter sp.]|uniref:AI-2E family transporter n=1 Tax=Oscillibacter sp. TaxID=1945593 RepID=UPI00261E9152|nr:AI-2E family transporter [Oscillibacter sp.]MDD3346159.1 AI-2E family transporter [Oscillibacter sp.]
MKQDAHVKLGLAAFVTVSAILLFYDTLFGSRVLPDVWAQLMSAIQPIGFGALMAYLLAPVVNFFDEKLLALAPGKSRGQDRPVSPGVRAVSILLTWAVICVLIYLLASVLLPELYRSILQLIANAETYYRTVSGWVEQLLETNPSLERWVAAQMDTYFADVQTWLEKEALPQAQTVMSALSGGVVSALVFLKNLLVGVIVSVYLLATKERCGAYARKMAYGLFSTKNVHWVLRGVRKVDSIFSGFVRGKLLDSLIIGILCFICCSILKFPYTPLVSVIVGVTNVIPFFGPFLGAIPSTFLILLVSPIKALYFVLFILALQQLDGNVIGPKILGGKTGLSSLWVIIAILVGGGFFGLPGMFFGVPVCACLYSAVTFFLEVRLRKKHLPLDIEAYRAGMPEPRGAEPIPPEEEPRP